MLSRFRRRCSTETNPVRRRLRRTIVGHHLRAVAATEPVSEEALLRRVATGDEQAFAALYDLLAPLVYGVCRRVVRHSAVAEEVAQEALIDVWRGAARFDDQRGSVRAWAVTIAHRRAVDRVRAEASRVDREDRVWRADPGRRTTTDDVADDVVGAEIERLTRIRTRRAVEQLTDLQRQAIEQAFFAGRTHTEIAGTLNVPLGTVKTRIRDGLIKLGDLLGEQR